MENEITDELKVKLVHQKDYIPYFVCEVNKKLYSFTPIFIDHNGKDLTSEITISSEILESTDEEREQVRAIYIKNKILMTSFYDLAWGEIRFAFSLPLLKELLNLDLTDSERAKVQAYIAEFTCIYLIRDTQTKLVKIGKSSNPYVRLKTLIRQDTLMPQPNDFSLIFHWTDYPSKERELHRIYEAARIRGEWFELSENDIEEIYNKHADKKSVKGS